jgi:hypothetical protein
VSQLGLGAESLVTQLPNFPALLSDPTPLFTPTPYMGPRQVTDSLDDPDNAVGTLEDQVDLLSVEEQMFLEMEGSDGLRNPVPETETALDPGYPDVRRPNHPL